MFLAPGTGEELPGQRNPDGTPKANTDPTRNNPTNPNAPPPVVYSAPIPRYAFLGEGVPAAIESANSGTCLSFDAYCTFFVPELAGAGMWLRPAEDPSLCVTARSGSVYLDACIETPVNDSQLWVDRPEADGIAFTLRTRASLRPASKPIQVSARVPTRPPNGSARPEGTPSDPRRPYRALRPRLLNRTVLSTSRLRSIGIIRRQMRRHVSGWRTTKDIFL